MTSDAADRWWRRKGWLALLGFAVLLYPLLLLGSSDFGSSVGLSRDVNARRALARALSYAADPRLPVARGNDGEVATPALDGNLVALQLGDAGLGPGGGSPSSITGIGGASPANPGAGGVALSTAPTAPQPGAAPSAVAAPSPVAQPPTTTQPPAGAPPTGPPVAPPPPVSPPPSPAPTPVPTPAPTPNCSRPPAGAGTFDGQVRDPNGNKVKIGATVQLYWSGCLIATVVTGKGGKFAITGLAAGTRYNYVVTAPQFNPGSGAFTTDASGDHTEDPQLQ